jgi:hypothetical protein
MIEGDDGSMTLGAEAPRGCGGLFGKHRVVDAAERGR